MSVEGLRGPAGGNERTRNGWADGISPYSARLHPLPEPLPKKDSLVLVMVMVFGQRPRRGR